MLTIRELIKTLNNAFNQKLKKHRGNWEQNDPTADDYIKNRPFYTDNINKTVIISEQKVTIDASEQSNSANLGFTTFSISPIIPLVEGQTYEVNWDGKNYTCTGKFAEGLVAIGDEGLFTGAEVDMPFFIAIDKDAFGGAYVGAYVGTHTVEVLTDKVIKIDKKYLPDINIPETIGAKGSGYNAEIFNGYERNEAAGDYSHAEGETTHATGYASHAEGAETWASESEAHAEGLLTYAEAQASHAEGMYTHAMGLRAHAEGYYSNAIGDNSHAEGQSTEAKGEASHAEGYSTHADGAYSHAEGSSNYASGGISHAEGHRTTASGAYSHAEGVHTTASGSTSHAEGSETTASMDYSHAEGFYTTASKIGAHAEGCRTTASGDYAHAEGSGSTASGFFSHAEGQSTEAIGNHSHAEGHDCIARGHVSHAEGGSTEAIGNYSHAEGNSTIATSMASHVQGSYNIQDTEQKYAHIVGNGKDSNSRSNAHTLDWNGLGWFAGGLKVGGTGQDDADAKIVATQEYVDERVNGSSAKDYVILKSSVEGSTKQFKLTIDDEGTLSATEIIEEVE